MFGARFDDYDPDGLAYGKSVPFVGNTVLVVLGAFIASTLAAASHWGGAKWQAVFFFGLVLGIALLGIIYIQRQFIAFLTLFLTFTMPISLNVGLFEIVGEPNPAGSPTNLTLWDKDIYLIILGLDLLVDMVLRRGKTSFKLGKTSGWLTAFFITCFGFPVHSVCPTRSFVSCIELLRFILIFVYLVKRVGTKQFLQWIVWGICAQVWIECGIAILQSMMGGKIGLAFLGEQRVKEMSMPGGAFIRSGALLGHPNSFGLWLILINPTLLALTLNPMETGKRRVFYGSTWLWSVMNLILTFSRAGWMAFVLTFFATWFLALRRFGRPLMITIVLPVMGSSFIGILLIALVEEIRYRIFGEGGQGSAFARIPQIMTALNIITHLPFFGTGLGSYTPYIAKYANFDGRFLNTLFFRVHNGLLLWFAETGIPGGIAYVGLWSSIIKKSWKSWEIKDDFLAMVGLGTFVGLGGWAFKAMGNIHSPLMEPTLWLSFAMVFIVWNCVDEKEYARIKGTT
ncbi:MAG: O-antigen ligase family protein [Planctomycetota bacterium]|nr:O-antigen ligase family protein [Planctomycetota bacterium]